MKIEFDYIDNDKCSLKKWKGCCCECVYHLLVTKHCCSSPQEKGCVCNDSLDFYVCILFYNIEGRLSANLSGKHGMCECFTKRKLINE